MTKYIDAEKLKAEIEVLKRRKGFLPFDNFEITEAYMVRGVQFTCDDIVNIITSLQQEQPGCVYGRTLEERKKYCKFCSAVCKARIDLKQSEVDLEKEYNEQWGGYTYDGLSATIDRGEFEQIARYFYELGLNVKVKEHNNDE